MSLVLFLVISSCLSILVASQDLPILLRRVSKPQSSLRVLQSDANVSDVNEYAYLIPVIVGENDPFECILDTGSSDLWIVSSACSDPDCNAVPKYPQNSHSNHVFKLNYLLGSVLGSIVQDVVQIGLYAITSQSFGSANQIHQMNLASTGNSGVLGLAFPSEASIPDAATLLENLISALPEPNRFFAIKLGRDYSSITIGSLDSNITSDLSQFHLFPVSLVGSDNYDYWKLPMQYFTINSTVFPLSSSLLPGAKDPIGVLDTGTTLIIGPTSDVDAYYISLGQLARRGSVGMWQVKCTTPLIIGIVLGSKEDNLEFVLDPADVNWDDGNSDDGWCLGGIQANDHVNSGDWLLGDVFLRNVYVTYYMANSTHSPMMGIMGTTDSEKSSAQFVSQRGADSTPFHSIQIHSGQRGVSLRHMIVVYALSALCGFIGGASITLLYRRRASTKADKGVYRS